MIEILRAYWLERAGRERAAIKLAAVLVAAALCYAYAWVPVTRERDRLLVRVPELRAEAEAMERDALELQELKRGGKPGADLSNAILAAASASRIAAGATQIAANVPGRARVSIASVGAEQAFAWVADLQTRHGVRLEAMHVRWLGDGDRVRVDAMLAEAR